MNQARFLTVVAILGTAAVITAAAGARTALLAIVASGAVFLTRLRFAAPVAAALLAVTAALTLTAPEGS